MLVEINFDGLVGPSHNYAGLSLGNLAATRSAGRRSYPRAAALEGVAKMRANLALGLHQGLLLPHARPDRDWLAELGTEPSHADAAILANAMSASAMWAANAATVSPAPDTADGRCHLTVANLRTMPHRSHEWTSTYAQLRVTFADPAFAVHPAVPPGFGDEGAANHMRIGTAHDAACTEVFVYGDSGGPYPARQHIQACRAVARLNRLDASNILFVAQSEAAIAAGAFHNDVVAVANEAVLLVHEQAFADPQRFYGSLRALQPDVDIIEVPAAEISLADAVASYLFNAQLVTQPDGAMALIVPAEVRAIAPIWAWLQRLVAGNGPVRRLEVVDVRQSMANGGGPACLRLRVVADPARVDPRFMVDTAKLDRIAELVTTRWPEHIEPLALHDPALIATIEDARAALLAMLDLTELL